MDQVAAINSDIIAVCYEGEIRLLGGPTAAQGTVELCARNQWDAICDPYWSANDAKVVCRQLGFNRSEFCSSCPLSHLAKCSPSSITGVAVYNSYYGLGASRYVWSNVAGGCKGNETTLLSCPRNTLPVTCTLNELAGVECSVPCKVTYMYTPYPPSICLNNSLYILMRLNYCMQSPLAKCGKAMKAGIAIFLAVIFDSWMIESIFKRLFLLFV